MFKHNYVNQDVLMAIVDNYMFRHLLAIFRFSSRELMVLLYTGLFKMFVGVLTTSHT